MQYFKEVLFCFVWKSNSGIVCCFPRTGVSFPEPTSGGSQVLAILGPGYSISSTGPYGNIIMHACIHTES